MTEALEQTAARLVEVHRALSDIANELKDIAPGISESLESSADAVYLECLELNQLVQWTRGPSREQIRMIAAWLRDSRRAVGRTQSRSRSPVRGTGRQYHQCE